MGRGGGKALRATGTFICESEVGGGDSGRLSTFESRLHAWYGAILVPLFMKSGYGILRASTAIE